MVSRRFRVAWADTDASGRIHNTAAIRWAEVVEHDLMRSLGVVGVGSFPRRALDVEFSAALRFGDEFDLELEVERVGRTSVTYAWHATRAEGEREGCFSGHTTVVHVDDDGRPQPLPAALREAR